MVVSNSSLRIRVVSLNLTDPVQLSACHRDKSATGRAMSEFVFADYGMLMKTDRVTRNFTRLSKEAGFGGKGTTPPWNRS
jgi:hypothetical protein